MTAGNTSMLKARQQLHREQLKLARLKTQINKSRLKDERLRLRLGSLCYLVGWNTLSEKQLESQVMRVKQALDADSTETIKTHGSHLINLVITNNIRAPASRLRDPELRRAARHQQITIGGMLLKHGLQQVQKATLLGAIYTVSGLTDYAQILNPSQEQKKPTTLSQR